MFPLGKYLVVFTVCVIIKKVSVNILVHIFIDMNK